MKRNLFLLILFFSFSCSAQAQIVTEKANANEPAAVVNKLWEAMRKKDGEAIKGLFLPAGQLVAIDQPRDGKGASTTRVLSADDFAKLIVEKKGEFIERMPRPDVGIYGDLAVVSGRYTFHVGEQFSHCGTNTFNLARTTNGWKIANAASTLEFQCENDLKKLSATKNADMRK